MLVAFKTDLTIFIVACRYSTRQTGVSTHQLHNAATEVKNTWLHNAHGWKVSFIYRWEAL